MSGTNLEKKLMQQIVEDAMQTIKKAVKEDAAIIESFESLQKYYE